MCSVQQLMEAVRNENVRQSLLVLAHSTPDDVNQLHPPENQGPLHLACHRGLIVLTQLLIWVSVGEGGWKRRLSKQEGMKDFDGGEGR